MPDILILTLKINFILCAQLFAHSFIFTQVIIYFTEKIINNREIFLDISLIEKFPVMFFVHNHIRLFFALKFADSKKSCYY